MSGNASASAHDSSVRRRKNVRSEQSVRKLLDAAVDALAHAPYSDLTVRSVAARASVSPTTAYTYFPSKDALIAEVYLRTLRDARVFVDVNDSAETRITAQLRELVLLVADTPYLADACTIALMADDSVVDEVRVQIATEIARRINNSLGPGVSPDLSTTLHMVFSGAMMHARSIVGGYHAMADQLDKSVRLIMSSEFCEATADSKMATGRPPPSSRIARRGPVND
jgi:TetR/AcrR family transcriptional regulator, cholesterol catabolism regulator